mmetsp:Transcript_52248/g.125113  ORF Transcript_52248/g.125113 Transcript_52248/m.125113 type:complete len:252 (+) Transcript_52248:1245-2000(+)
MLHQARLAIVHSNGSLHHIGISAHPQQNRAQQYGVILWSSLPAEQQKLWIFPHVLSDPAGALLLHRHSEGDAIHPVEQLRWLDVVLAHNDLGQKRHQREGLQVHRVRARAREAPHLAGPGPNGFAPLGTDGVREGTRKVLREGLVPLQKLRVLSLPVQLPCMVVHVLVHVLEVHRPGRVEVGLVVHERLLRVGDLAPHQWRPESVVPHHRPLHIVPGRLFGLHVQLLFFTLFGALSASTKRTIDHSITPQD